MLRSLGAESHNGAYVASRAAIGEKKIADLNREKLELDIAPELHEIAGLAA
jgi:hypothetical protein